MQLDNVVVNSTREVSNDYDDKYWRHYNQKEMIQCEFSPTRRRTTGSGCWLPSSTATLDSGRRARGKSSKRLPAMRKRRTSAAAEFLYEAADVAFKIVAGIGFAREMAIGCQFRDMHLFQQVPVRHRRTKL